MKTPKALKKGDTIGLLSVSSPVPPTKLNEAVEKVKSLGFNVVVGKSCYQSYGYLAGKDDLRAYELNEMFRNPKIDGIFCMRGGYGAMKILPLLDLQSIKNNPKVFIGYSDVTALHIVFNQQCEFVTFHSPMPSTEFIKPEMDQFTWDSFLKNIMEPGRSSCEIENPDGIPFTTLVDGVATGQLVGGNLTLVTATLGTPYEINTKGKILFLEDIDEYERSIDRMLTQLKLAGKFHDATGILLGCWTDCEPIFLKDPEKSLSLQTVFEEILLPIGKPVLMNVACGHCLPTLTLPLGKTVTFNTAAKKIRVI